VARLKMRGGLGGTVNDFNLVSRGAEGEEICCRGAGKATAPAS